jgi:hypothetical protein
MLVVPLVHGMLGRSALNRARHLNQRSMSAIDREHRQVNAEELRGRRPGILRSPWQWTARLTGSGLSVASKFRRSLLGSAFDSSLLAAALNVPYAGCVPVLPHAHPSRKTRVPSNG